MDYPESIQGKETYSITSTNELVSDHGLVVGKMGCTVITLSTCPRGRLCQGHTRSVISESGGGTTGGSRSSRESHPLMSGEATIQLNYV